MALEARIQELAKRHSDLETAIDQETKRPLVDTVRVQAMKKEKLRLKDEISELSLVHH
jgi:hypothetical protein